MRITIENTAAQLAQTAAQDIADFIRRHPGALLCFAAGDTPLQTLRALVHLQAAGEVDLSSAYYVALDEWVGIGYETAGSCVQVMRDTFYCPAGLSEDRLCLWDGLATDLDAQCRRIEQFIAEHGGLGYTLLGIGMNGHIGFNEPHTVQTGGCLVTPLDEVTAQVGRKYFGGQACPTQGMSLSKALLLTARRTALMATGSHKAPILRQAIINPPSDQVPASCLQTHPHLTVYLDQAVWQAL